MRLLPAILLALAAPPLLALACGHPGPAKPVAVSPGASATACEGLPPPPAPRSFEVLEPPAGSGLAGCLDTGAAVAISAEIGASRAWMAEAWARCGARDGGADR